MRVPRRLTEAEIEIWLQVTQSVSPRPGSHLPSRGKPPAPPPPAVQPSAPEAPRRASANSYSPPQPKPGPAPPLAPFERRFRRKVAGGKVGIEAVLDLHGMTQAEAHGALHGFLLRAQRDGARLVMIVTGKGKRDRASHSGERQAGVLRRTVPYWLRDPVLRSIVLGFEEAAAGHGGIGALYVRLRRREIAAER